MSKDLMIRSSAQEFITFKVQEKDKEIQVRYENEIEYKNELIKNIEWLSIKHLTYIKYDLFVILW